MSDHDAGSRAGSSSLLRVSVVIPAFNESIRLPPTLRRLRLFAEASERAPKANAMPGSVEAPGTVEVSGTVEVLGAMRVCEVIVVDDGSADATSQIVADFDGGPFAVRLLVNPGNRGKGYSIRRGALAAEGDAVLVADADMDTPFEEVTRLLPWLGKGYDVVIGSRAMPDSVVDPPRPWRRRAAAAAFRVVRRRILLPDLLDTQCGFKCYSRAAAQEVFAAATCDGYAADCEVLALARRMGFGVKEIGVRWESQSDSHIRILRDGWKMLGDLRAIRRRIDRDLSCSK